MSERGLGTGSVKSFNKLQGWDGVWVGTGLRHKDVGTGGVGEIS